jgi:hypothetical protein
MPKYLRRKSDGMVFGYNQEMAKSSLLEEVEMSEEEASKPFDEQEGDPESEAQKAARLLGLSEDDLQGYPDKGYAPTPDAPFGKNKPKHGTNKEGTVANPAPSPKPAQASLQFQPAADVERGDGTPTGLPDVNPDASAQTEEGISQEEADKQAAEGADISFEPAHTGRGKNRK